mmetsp:Transcript_4738/g.15736  ORF Transcript_4738/g.15736 Transcript_4738/m.15736 type:complete len:229 (+) Transcript_4738:855-1541(+)
MQRRARRRTAMHRQHRRAYGPGVPHLLENNWPDLYHAVDHPELRRIPERVPTPGQRQGLCILPGEADGHMVRHRQGGVPREGLVCLGRAQHRSLMDQGAVPSDDTGAFPHLRGAVPEDHRDSERGRRAQGERQCHRGQHKRLRRKLCDRGPISGAAGDDTHAHDLRCGRVHCPHPRRENRRACDHFGYRRGRIAPGDRHRPGPQARHCGEVHRQRLPPRARASRLFAQ